MREKKLQVAFFLYGIMMLCSVMMCAGCQKAPEEVQERMEHYGNNEQVTAGELTRCTVEELKKTKRSDVREDTDNIKLPEEIDFSGIGSLSVLDMAFEDAYSENKDKYIGFFGIDASTVKTIKPDGQADFYESDNEKDKKYFAITDYGFMSYLSGMTYEYIKDEIEQFDTEETYEVGVDDLTQKTVRLGRDEVSITDMAAAAEKWLETEMPIEKCNYRVTDAYVRNLKQNGRSEKQLTLGAGIMYEGMQFDPYTDDFSKDGAPSMMSILTSLNYDRRNQISFYSNGCGKLRVNAARPVTEVVDLDSAVRLVNETVSGFQELKVSKLIPLYALFLKPAGEEGERSRSVPGRKVEGRPVYAFLINTDYDEVSDFGILKSAEHYVYVDMETGEVTTDLETEEDEGK